DNQEKSISTYRAQVQQMEQELKKAQDDTNDKQEYIDQLNRDLSQMKEETDSIRQESQAKDLSMSTLQAMTDEKTKVNTVLVDQLKDEVKKNGDQLAAVTEKLTVAEAKLKQVQAGHDD